MALRVRQTAVSVLGSGRSAARLARLLREQEVGSSNLPAPTTKLLSDKRSSRLACLFSLCLLAASLAGPGVGPARAAEPATYLVAAGDNLSVIAARFGVTVKELKQANGLTRDVIHVGQQLTIRDPLHLTRDRDVRWARPVPRPGAVLRPFGQYKVKGVLMPRTGADVACPWGTTVSSPANGVVRHIGAMDGFGTLVIIDHGGGYASVLAPFDPDTLKVTVGQAVNRGSPLGVTSRPDALEQDPFLHVELRHRKKSIKPDRLLK